MYLQGGGKQNTKDNESILINAMRKSKQFWIILWAVWEKDLSLWDTTTTDKNGIQKMREFWGLESILISVETNLQKSSKSACICFHWIETTAEPPVTISIPMSEEEGRITLENSARVDYLKLKEWTQYFHILYLTNVISLMW